MPERADCCGRIVAAGITPALHSIGCPTLHQRDISRRELRLPLRGEPVIGRWILSRIHLVVEHHRRELDADELADPGELRLSMRYKILVVQLDGLSVDRWVASESQQSSASIQNPDAW